MNIYKKIRWYAVQFYRRIRNPRWKKINKLEKLISQQDIFLNRKGDKTLYTIEYGRYGRQRNGFLFTPLTIEGPCNCACNTCLHHKIPVSKWLCKANWVEKKINNKWTPIRWGFINIGDLNSEDLQKYLRKNRYPGWGGSYKISCFEDDNGIRKPVRINAS